MLSLAALLAAMALPWFVHRFSLRQTVLAWAAAALVAGSALALMPSVGLFWDVPLMAVLGTIGVLHPLVMAHGRLLLAPEMRGRGLGLLSTFVFLGSGAAAWVFELVADASLAAGSSPSAVYTRIFGLASAMVFVGIVAYAVSPSLAQAATSRLKRAS